MQHKFRLLQLSLLALLAFLVPGLVVAGKFYKCIDANGEIQYQQVACDSTTEQNTVRVYTEPKHRSQLGSTLIGTSEYIAEGVEPASVNRVRFQTGLTHVLGLLEPIKTAVVQFYMMNGGWPETPQAMGFEQENLNSSQIEELLMGDGGVIVAWLSNEFGAEKKVVLIPTPVMDGTSFEWRCLANFPAQALNLGGATLCESRSSH
ncbi:MAG: DUF4124 domain-containing protein [Candidatus Thiodiazotropha sp. (ex Epidulcina cf. delphinae)]|nr:DUF4124 domain-containing protein [Candidatus Thiodiazotropha sp. (ex Epidulcina cf. delphinae)]